MSHIQSHHSGAEGATDSFLAIFKVHGGAIHLYSRELSRLLEEESHEFRISCKNVGYHPGRGLAGVRVLALNEFDKEPDECNFREQTVAGQVLRSNDLVIFMSTILTSWQQASFAISLGLSARDESARCEDANLDKIGSCYLCLNPEFSTQGIQKTPLLDPRTNMPMGRIQVDYLMVTHPVALGVPSPRPGWLFERTGLEAGHRGAGSGRRTDLPEKLLENTIDSFNFAHRAGADVCELDVLMSADGIPIVYHDFDVDAAAAHKSSDQLGKFRAQVNQFAHKQLRDFRLLAANDCEGCPYTLNVPDQAEGNRPFPSLEDVLVHVDATCGMNLEIKWPQLLDSGKSEARRFREINDFVERIIQVVDQHARERRIVLQSFDADLAILLRLKQTRFPVVFLSQGMTERYERYADLRARSIWTGICLAQAFDMAGLDIIADDYFEHGKELVDCIRRHNLIARAWGDVQGSKGKLEALKRLNLQCITYDKVDLVKRETG